MQQKNPQTKPSFFGFVHIDIFSSELNTFQVEGKIQVLVLKGRMSSNWLLCLLYQIIIRIIKISARLRTLDSDIPLKKTKKPNPQKNQHKSQKDKVYIFFITSPSIRVWYKKQLTSNAFSQDVRIWNSCVNDHVKYLQ